MRFDRGFVPILSLVLCCVVGADSARGQQGDDDPVVATGMAAIGSRAPVHPSDAQPLPSRDGGGAPSLASQWLAAQGVSVPAGPAVRSATAVTPGGLIGTNFPIANFADAVTTSEALDTSSVAYTPARDEYLVVWHAFERVTLTNIYGQRVAANGALVGDRIVICDAPGAQAAPSVSYEPVSGTYWVVWTDFRDGTGDIRIRQVSRTGPLLGSEMVLNEGTATGFAARIACAIDNCAVVWVSDPPDGNPHILLRAFNVPTLVTYSFVLLSDTTSFATEPDICYNGHDARFLVVWQQAVVGGTWDIWSFHLTWDIYGLGNDARKAISTAANGQQKPRVAYGASAQRYLVVWEDYRSGGSWDVFGQRLERSGAFAGGALAIFPGPFDDLQPVVAGRDGANAEFLVAFVRDISGATQYQIYASRVAGNGAVAGAFKVRDTYNYRYRPAIVNRSWSDDFLIAFTDEYSATQPDIDARVARGSGTLAGGPIVVSRGRKGQEAPAVAYNSLRNEYVAVWADYRFLDDYDIFYRRISAAGAAVPPEFVLASAASLYGDPTIAHNSVSDGYLAVWQEITSTSTGYEVYGRLLSGALEPLAAPILVSRDTITSNEGRARVVFNPVSGNYLVVWHAYTGGQWRVWGQRIAANGALLGGNFPISDGAGVAQNPRVAHNRTANEYVVVWQDGRNPSADGTGQRVDVYAQRFGPAGGLAGGNFPISTATGNKNKCDIAYSLAHNEFLAVWGDRRSGDDDIWAQRLAASGALSGAAFPVVATEVGESSPAVAYDVLSHEFLVTYWAFNQSTDYDIWARRVPCNSPPTVPAFPLSGALEQQSRCELAQNATTTEFLVVWQDFRNGSYDIYGQRWMRLPRSRVHRVLPPR